MLTLLKADIRRLFTRKGNFYGYMVAYLALVLLISVGVPMLSNLINSLDEPELYADTSALYTSPLSFLASSLLIFGLVSIFASWCVTSVCWSDMRGGFNRTIVGCVGKKAYFVEKLVLALAVSLVFVIVGSVVGTAAAAAFVGLAGMGSVPSLLAWWVLLTLASWGNACLTLAILWLFKSNVLGMLIGLALPSGLVSLIVSLVVGNIPVVGEGWAKVASWLPCEALTTLSNVTNDVLVLDGGQVAHVLVPTAVCLAAAFALALTVLRRHDL